MSQHLASLKPGDVVEVKGYFACILDELGGIKLYIILIVECIYFFQAH